MRCLQIVLILIFYLLQPARPKKIIYNITDYIISDYTQTKQKQCNRFDLAHFGFLTGVRYPNKYEFFKQTYKDTYNKYATLYLTLINCERPMIHGNDTIDRLLKRAKMDFFGRNMSVEIEQLATKIADMYKLFGTAEVCTKTECRWGRGDVPLYDLEGILAESSDYDTQLDIWRKWRDVSGKELKSIYSEFVDLMNLWARNNGFKDRVAFLKYFYDDDDPETTALRLWKDVEPLYLELHKYVSKKLKVKYSQLENNTDGMLPGHILGNMWGESWSNLEQDVMPFPDQANAKLNLDKITPFEMYKIGERHFRTLGFPEMLEVIEDTHSMLTKPTDDSNGQFTDVICFPTSYRHCSSDNSFRISMCARNTIEDFFKIYRELGHVHYHHLYHTKYSDLNAPTSAAFFDTIGDVVALSGTSPSRLLELKLHDPERESYESLINHLMRIALIKIPYLPMSLVTDFYRWEIYEKKIPESEWNSRWWDYREKFQRIKAPIERSPEHFDAGSKYEVVLDREMLPTFFATFMAFQIYKNLCIKTFEYNPNVNITCPMALCNMYDRNTFAEPFLDIMSQGYSIDWRTALKMLSGSTEIMSGPLLEYFDPLYRFLKEENQETESFVLEKQQMAPPQLRNIIAIVLTSILIIAGAIIGISYCLMYRAEVRDDLVQHNIRLFDLINAYR